MDAEAAANAASVQLVSFKEALENEFSVCCQSVLLYIEKKINSASMINHHNAVYFYSRTQGLLPVENKKLEGKDVF